MRLLFVTQVVDRNDAVLGAYHGWLTELAKRFEHIEVICLYEGEHTLPANVRVHSLGKEKGEAPSFVYAFRFLRLAWQLHSSYDTVFVHMNQEYLLLAGWLWKLLGKRMYLWRNHYAGSWLTDAAAWFCTSVFCTSTHSYTAKHKKTVLMPVGVDTERFHPNPAVIRTPRSILFLARMAPSKRPDMLVDALITLHAKGVEFTAAFYGSPLPQDEPYYRSLIERVEASGLVGIVGFHPAVANAETSSIYQQHEIFVNCSPSGMFDKTLFEAAVSNCLVLAASDDFAERMGESVHFTDADSLAERLGYHLELAAAERTAFLVKLKRIAGENALPQLVDALSHHVTGHGAGPRP